MCFNLYFAGSQAKEVDEYIKQKKGCRLFSYADSLKGPQDYMATAPHCKLFMDSGAFSVFHNGAVIDIDAYISFINSTPGIAVFAQLDDIPFPILDSKTAKESSEGSWEKYLYMMDRVNDEYRDKLLPIYHFGEPYSALERILNTEVHGRVAPYIGIGGRHGVSTKDHYKYFDRLFEIIGRSKNPNVKIHAFGMTVLPLLESYPFYSADSTTWLKLGVNGSVFTKTAGIVCISSRSQYSKKAGKLAFVNLPKQTQEKLIQEFENKGYSLQQLQDDYKARLKCNVDYILEWSKNYKHKPINHIRRGRLI